MDLKGFKRIWKVPKGFERFCKVLKGSERFQKVQKVQTGTKGTKKYTIQSSARVRAQSPKWLGA